MVRSDGPFAYAGPYVESLIHGSRSIICALRQDIPSSHEPITSTSNPDSSKSDAPESIASVEVGQKVSRTDLARPGI